MFRKALGYYIVNDTILQYSTPLMMPFVSWKKTFSTWEYFVKEAVYFEIVISQYEWAHIFVKM